MNILVTGGAGFIASQIAEAYINQGHDITVLDNLSRGSKNNISPKAKLVVMDVCDVAVRDLFAKSKFDIVNHHAAQIDVVRSVKDPTYDATVNVMGTINLLESCRTFGIRKFIFASSGGAIYGECEARPAVEGDPPRPESPYGISKYSAESYIRFFGKCHRVPYTILRYANVFGPRQDPQGEAGVVSVFINKLLMNSGITIYGSGRQVRDYVYVGDIVSANCAALTNGEYGTYNISTQAATSVNALYETLSRIRPFCRTPTYAPARPGEIEWSVLDSSLARRQMDWRPNHSLEYGLQLTYAYFKRLRDSAWPTGQKAKVGA